jgi:hypothetical protein
VEDGVVKTLKETGAALILPVERAAPAEAKKLDPYRPALQFLAGLLAFCLALIVALFAALGADKGHAINALVSWVLAGISITAVAGTMASGLLQWAKSSSPDKMGRGSIAGVILAVVTVLCGAATVYVCADGALKIARQQCIAKPAEGLGNDALITLLKTQQGIVPRAYADARSRDCFAAGDLGSSAAWAEIAKKF